MECHIRFLHKNTVTLEYWFNRFMPATDIIIARTIMKTNWCCYWSFQRSHFARTFWFQTSSHSFSTTFSSSHIFFHVLTKPPPCIFTIIRKMLCITCSVQKKVYLYWVLIEKYYVCTVPTEIYLECSKHATKPCKGYAVRHV